MMMVHVTENLLNWVQSLILGAEVDASTLNCIREQLESQRRFECTEVLKRLEFFVASVENKSQNTSLLSPS